MVPVHENLLGTCKIIENTSLLKDCWQSRVSERFSNDLHVFILQTTAVELLPTDLKYYQMFGGNKVHHGGLTNP